MGSGQFRQPLHDLRPADGEAAGPGLAASVEGPLNVDWAAPTSIKALAYAAAAFAFALPLMILSYKLIF